MNSVSQDVVPFSQLAQQRLLKVVLLSVGQIVFDDLNDFSLVGLEQ